MLKITCGITDRKNPKCNNDVKTSTYQTVHEQEIFYVKTLKTEQG